MDLKTKLHDALKDAMRSKDELRKSTLRMVLSAIQLAEVDKGSALDDQGVMAILHKEVKSRRESIADAERAGRPEMIQAGEAEIKILEDFLPKGFSTEELDALALQAIAEAGATTVREMGAVMKILMPRLQGRATGDQASQAVRRHLQG
jgi:uncharacterized protein YqeY